MPFSGTPRVNVNTIAGDLTLAGTGALGSLTEVATNLFSRLSVVVPCVRNPAKGALRTETASQSEVDSMLLKGLANHYSLRDPVEVVAFLKRNTFLLPVLVELPTEVRSAFGGHPTLILQPAAYEPSERYDEIQVLIQTDRDATSALECLHAFDESWWLDRYDQTEGKVSVHLEFT